MNINAIVCVNNNWGIGKEGKLLYHIPKDLERFKEHTEGNIIVYGRKTLETFPNRLPLKNRKNIVLTRNLDNISSDIKNSVDYFGVVKKMKNKDAMFNVVALKSKDYPKFSNSEFSTSLLVVDSIDMLIHTLNIISDKNSQIWIAGGESIYNQLLPYCNMVFVTQVQDDKEADSYFPNLDEKEEFKLYYSTTCKTTEDQLKYRFIIYSNTKNSKEYYNE